MSRYSKVLEKLLNPRSTLNFQELEYLLGRLGYLEIKTGKTSGSRRAYINERTKHIIRIHKPHPGNEIKKYVQRYIIGELQRQELI